MPLALYARAMRRSASTLITLAVAGLLAIVATACGTPKKAGVNGVPDAGTGIGQPSPFLSANLSTISCGSGNLCAAGGAPFEGGAATPILAYSHTSGAKWSPARSTSGAGATITSTACAATRCVAVGIIDALPLLLSISTSSPSRTWTSTAQPSAGTLVAVGCAGTSTCLGLARTSAGGLETVRSTRGPWSSLGSPPTDLASPVTMECVSTRVCTAVGTSATGTPVVMVTRSGGTTWSLAEISKKATVILGASCRIDGVCWVVGRKGAATLLVRSSRPDTPFLKVVPPDGLGSVNDVSCAGTTCVLAGASSSGQGAAAAYFGASASILDVSFAPTPLLTVSCGTATACSAATTSSLVDLKP